MSKKKIVVRSIADQLPELLRELAETHQRLHGKQWDEYDSMDKAMLLREFYFQLNDNRFALQPWASDPPSNMDKHEQQEDMMYRYKRLANQATLSFEETTEELAAAQARIKRLEQQIKDMQA